MVERLSALRGYNKIGIFGKKEKAGIVMSEIKNLILYQVAAWPNTLDKVGTEIAQSLGLNKYPGPNRAIEGNQLSLLRIEPLKWWIVNQKISDLSIDDGTFLDLSHSRTLIRISGQDAATLLNRHLPIDLRELSFPVNSVANTVLHHAGVTLWKSNHGFELFLPRAYALSLWEVLLESSAQFGYEVK